VYAGLLGPSYETPAEILWLERAGADAVGMSTVIEVIAARARRMKCLGFSTVTNLAAVKHDLAVYDPEVVQGTVLDRAEIDRQIELYRSRSADERREIVGLQPKRAEVILAGACIVRTVLDKLGRDSLIASDRGLRHGLMLERFGG